MFLSVLWIVIVVWMISALPLALGLYYLSLKFNPRHRFFLFHRYLGKGTRS